MRAWPARRVAWGVVVGLLLLSAALLGRLTPLQAQEGEAAAPQATGASGVSIRLDDLVDLLTYSIVHRFEVQVSNLDAAVTYDVMVSSSNAPALGIGGCGQAAQTRTVTGATSQTLAFIVYACGLGAGTVTAEVRRTGASTAEVSVSQRMTAEPIPAWVPEDERPARGASGAVAQVGTPGFVKNPRFEQIMTTSVVAKWDTPTGDGGASLSGYGLLFWHKDDDHPSYRDDVLVKGLIPREHTYTGLQHDATYKFRIHACNKTPACGWWTNPPLEVTTEKAPAPHRPHTIKVSDVAATSVRVRWSAAANTGGVPLTGFEIKYWPYDARNPDAETGAQTVPADDGNDRSEPVTRLAASTEYELKMRACNGPKDSHCSSWSDDHRFTTLAGTSSTVPSNLDVVPLPGRDPFDRGGADRAAVLTWSPVDGADAYVVQARVYRQTAWSAGKCVGDTSDDPGRVTQPRCVIDLEHITNVGGSAAGLQDYNAYELQVRSKKGGETSEFSPRIVLIDTHITSANGKSPASGGRATLTWTPVDQNLSDSAYERGTYQFRYREIVNNADPEADIHHSHLAWEPNAFIPVETTTDNPYTGLTLYSIYGIQLIHTPRQQQNQPHIPRVFAAREVYVWPSNEPAGTDDRAGERVANFPLQYPLDNRLESYVFTYVYRICEETFPDVNVDHLEGRVGWVAFINDAVGQWADATGNLVRFKHEVYSADDEAVNPEHAEGTSKPCADHGPFARQIAEKVILSLSPAAGAEHTVDSIATDVQNMLARFRPISRLHNALVRAAIETQNEEVYNEIFMYEDDHKDLLFSELGELFDPFCNLAIACAPFRAIHPQKGPISDIALRRSAYTPDEGYFVPEIPNVQFEACNTKLAPNQQSAGKPFANRYSAIVHEVGHVLGIRSGSSGSGQQRHHPTISDSVMNHKTTFCAPTEFDAMAIHALYQHR